ncbi:MAG: glycine--tRNA ligase subunit beta [Candidatus Omnitrophica bacterium]|nr:glycine--tRNA ligase subunit beta [Candidatus Omnitrophota bacterium]
MPKLLVEIGVEELPLPSLDAVYAHLAQKTKDVFTAHRIAFGHVFVEATPRRIALFVDGLPNRQQDQKLELVGPSYEKAYDNQGKPTGALEGFLKSKKALLSDVKIKETPKGKFVAIQKREIGRPLVAIVPSLLGDIFTSLPFPKQMRWESSGFSFPRPIRWLVSLVDNQRVPFTLGGVKSGRQSYGHRFLAPKPFSILAADWHAYRTLLRKKHVMLCLSEREHVIAKALTGRFAQRQPDEDLVHTTAQLVEEPYLIKGTFSKSYLDLPAEVLASCMKKNQKIFACYDHKNRLLGTFVAVLNGQRHGLSRIQADFENVLESRLRDARYFYESDSQKPLEEKLPLLGQLVYLGKLGSMLQKTERLEKLGEIFCGLVGRQDVKDDLKRAARLSKVDLVTQLVYEFPDLQGIAGREYAMEGGEKEDIALAIGTQYVPKNLGENYADVKKQMNVLGAMLGIIDRLDLLAGAFGIHLEPTGSQDPFALRRAGGVLVKLIRAFGFQFSIHEALEAALGLYGNVLTVPKQDLMNHLKLFLQDRIAFELHVEAGGRSHEILQAVIKSSADNIADAIKRFEVLHTMSKNNPEDFLRAAKVVERTANILKGARDPIGEVRPEGLTEPRERQLYQLLESESAVIRETLENRDYEKATRLFGRVFYAPLHDFFSQIMVNVEDAAIRNNRQSLMKRIHDLYANRLADLSVLSRIDME